jgi:hypothetical protein
MWRRTFAVLAAVVGLLAITGTASAGGWAGSRYAKDDCTYTRETNTLYCEALFTTEVFLTAEPLTIPDATCASTIRIVERTGWRATTIRGYGFFEGRTPVAHKEIVGNEVFVEEHWHDYTDVSRGCA